MADAVIPAPRAKWRKGRYFVGGRRDRLGFVLNAVAVRIVNGDVANAPWERRASAPVRWSKHCRSFTEDDSGTKGGAADDPQVLSATRQRAIGRFKKVPVNRGTRTGRNRNAV